jgi:NAD(P)-dependent dehydrogenase (short-subunit alcohol dehydrogenase family)
LALARAGAAVALAARSADGLKATAEAIHAVGGRAIVVPADVTDWDAVASMVERVESDLGPIDVLVNNAGGAQAIGPLWELDPDVAWADVELNLRSVMLSMRAVIPSMVRRGVGRVINLGSKQATAPSPYLAPYSGAKAGLLMLTEGVDQSLTGTGVRVFIFSPGLVLTDSLQEAMTGEAGREWLPDLRDVPPARLNAPEQAGELAVLLATGAADALHGRFLHVNDNVPHLVREADRIVAGDMLSLRLRAD